MLVIPAIDLLDGKCTRLVRGDYDQSTTYHDDPLDVLARFLAVGAKRIHIVDLNGAKSGTIAHENLIIEAAARAREHGARVQFGGGIRSLDTVARLFNAGIDYLILGTAAILDASFRRALLAEYADRVILSVDSRDDDLATDGWLAKSGYRLFDFIDSLKDNPPAAIVFTDINRDGRLAGVNVDLSLQVAQQAPCPMIVSGGIGGLDDVRQLAAEAKTQPNLFGVIIGRAIYDGKIDLAEAIALQTVPSS